MTTPNIPAWLNDPTRFRVELGEFLIEDSNYMGARAQAAGALGATRDPAAAEYLLTALAQTRDSDLLASIIMALGRTLRTEATEPVRPYLDSKSRKLRDQAFMVEGFVGTLLIHDRMGDEWRRILKAGGGRHSNWTLDVIRYFGRHFANLDEREQIDVLNGGRRLYRHLPLRWIADNWPAMAAKDGGEGDRGPSPKLVEGDIEDLFGVPG